MSQSNRRVDDAPSGFQRVLRRRQGVKFRPSIHAGQFLPATRRQRPTERLNAVHRHRARAAEAPNRGARDVGVLFAPVARISPDVSASVILRTIVTNQIGGRSMNDKPKAAVE
jgi:hypothetical protein